MLNKAISAGLGAHDDSVLAAVISLGNGQVPLSEPGQNRRGVHGKSMETL